MTRSLVVRITLLFVLIVLATGAAQLVLLNRLTSNAFSLRQSEASDMPGLALAAATAVEALERAYAQGGWPAVGAFVTDSGLQARFGDGQLLVIDGSSRVRAASSPALLTASVALQEPTAEFGPQATRAVLVRAQSNSGGIESVFEVTTTAIFAMQDDRGQAFGTLVLLPPPIDADLGNDFANEVLQSAVLGLLALVALSMGATILVVRGSLRPIARLTEAAQELRHGRTPAPIRAEGPSEFSELIRTFNAAVDAITRTEQMRKGLIADIGHELRTPLTNLSGQLEALQAGLIKPDAEFIATLSDELRLLVRLAADFQQLAVSDAGQVRLVLEDLSALAAIEPILTPMAAGVGARLDLSVPADLRICVDTERLRQVFLNLVENAARHQPEGLSLSVTAEGQGEWARVEFRDNGPGVDPVDQPFIFERFYRADKSRSRDTGGAGLGLAIVRGLMEAMGGEIAYLPGGPGAAFVLHLPSRCSGLPLSAGRSKS